MKNKCKQYTIDTVVKDNDGTEYSAQIIDCSKCSEHMTCEGKEKYFSIIVYDKEK